jgi:hypothetical protein
VAAVAGTVVAVAAMRADVLGSGLGQGDDVQVAGAILRVTLALALRSVIARRLRPQRQQQLVWSICVDCRRSWLCTAVSAHSSW